MKIGFDIDGVLADFNSAFIARVIQVVGKDLFPPRPFDIPCWDYAQHYGYTAKQEEKVWESIWGDRYFWKVLPMYPEAAKLPTLSNARMARGDEIYFITKRDGGFAKRQTENWLVNNGFYRPTVLISGAKDVCVHALELDRYIDDKWENAAAVAALNQDCTVFLRDRPWNQRADDYNHQYIRTKDPGEIFDEDV